MPNKKFFPQQNIPKQVNSIEFPEKDRASPSVELPTQVFLFSGHMIDSPNRPQPRFPPAMETEAQEKIHQVLDQLQADSSNLAIAPGIACGGGYSVSRSLFRASDGG